MRRILLGLSAAAALAGLLAGCGERKKMGGMPPLVVTTAPAGAQDVPEVVDSFGQLTAPNDVTIMPQVSGKLLAVHFPDGARVKKGDVLFTIDPAEYRAALDRAEGQVAANTAAATYKKNTLERNAQLFGENLISKDDYDRARTESQAAAANLQISMAGRETARIDLEYCTLRSPIDGITGKRLVDPGNIVTGGGGGAPTKLVNLKTLKPLYVDFTVSEIYLDAIRRVLSAGALTVQILPRGETNRPFAGKVVFLDNGVNENAGTIALRAELPNEDEALWPGGFVAVELVLGTYRNAVVVPESAVQIGKNGPYAYVVNPAGVAEMRLLSLGPRAQGRLAILSGIQAGESVVVLGQLMLRPGASNMLDTAKAPAAGATNEALGKSAGKDR